MNDALAPAAVVFDLDGTLVDSRPDLTRAVVALRGELGLAPVGEATVGSWIGEGARRLVEKALAGSAHPVGPALARFLALYEPICTERTFPYRGVDELLAALRGRLPLALLVHPVPQFFEPLSQVGQVPVQDPPLGLGRLRQRAQ